MNALEWARERAKVMNERGGDLLLRAAAVLENNRYPTTHPAFRGIPFLRPGARFNGVWNWDTAFHAVGLSHFDTGLAQKQITGFLSLMLPDGMLPDNIRESGTIEIHSSKPPVFAWATDTVSGRSGNDGLILEVWDKLCRTLRFWETKRYDGTLFHYDSYTGGAENRKKYTGWESGWDNSARWDVNPWETEPIDLCCFLVNEYRAMARMAKRIGKDPADFEEKAADLAEKIERLLWNPEIGAYTDRNGVSGKMSDCLTPASFMPLFVGIASREHAERMAKLAADPKIFASVMPTVSISDPSYGDDYWRGPVWLNTAYFAAKGLKNYGFGVGEDVRENVLNLCYQNRDGIYENYDLITGKGMKANDFSWSAVFLIEFLLDF